MSSRIFELILTGYRNRTIGERFFGTASLSILLITVSEAASVSFTQKLLWAVAAQGAVALLAVLLSTFERKRNSQQICGSSST